MTTWYGPGFGIGTSWIVTLGPLATTASFIVWVDMFRIWDAIGVSLLLAVAFNDESIVSDCVLYVYHVL